MSNSCNGVGLAAFDDAFDGAFDATFDDGALDATFDDGTFNDGATFDDGAFNDGAALEDGATDERALDLSVFLLLEGEEAAVVAPTIAAATGVTPRGISESQPLHTKSSFLKYGFTDDATTK
jgi:hypothetical protein